MPESHIEEPSQYDSFGGCLFRVAWLLGPSLFGLIALYVVVERKTGLSSLDILYWVVLALLIVVRYADITWFKGTTAYGEPATLAIWRRYSLLWLAISIVLWLAAHGAAMFLSK